MNLIAKTTLIITASIAMLGTAQAGTPMQNAKGHAEKAIQILKEKADDDKGGHKSKAIRLLASAIAEIDAGVAFDQANKTKNENKKNN